MVISRLKIRDINEHLLCSLCNGYFIDASTITNCNHSFCRSCLLKHLNANATCPKCSCNKIKFRSDRILQRLVYKLVPNLYHNEVCRRQVFAAFDAQSGNLLRQSAQQQTDTTSVNNYNIVTCSDIINLKVVGKVSGENDFISFHLNCPSLLTIGLLCKFIRAKFEVGEGYEVLFHHHGELLHHHYNLIDVAYITNASKDCLVHLEFMIMSMSQKNPPTTPLKNIPTSQVKKRSPKSKSQSIKSYLMNNSNTTSFNPSKTSTPLLLDTPPPTTTHHSSSVLESTSNIQTSEMSKLPVLSDSSNHVTTSTSIVSPSQNNASKVHKNLSRQKATSKSKNSNKRPYTKKNRFSTLSIRSLLKNCVRSFNQPIKLEETSNTNKDGDGDKDERMKMEAMNEEEVDKCLQTQKNKQSEASLSSLPSSSSSSSLPSNSTMPSQLQLLLGSPTDHDFPTSNINNNNFSKTLYINDIFSSNIPLASYLNAPISLNHEASLPDGINQNGHTNKEDNNNNDTNNTNNNSSKLANFLLNNNLNFLLNVPYSNFLSNKPYLSAPNHLLTNPNNSNGVNDFKNCVDSNPATINNHQPIHNPNDLAAFFNTNVINNNIMSLRDHFSTFQNNITPKVITTSDACLNNNSFANISNEFVPFEKNINNNNNNNNGSNVIINNKIEEDDDRQLFTPASCDERQTLPSSLFVDVEE